MAGVGTAFLVISLLLHLSSPLGFPASFLLGALLVLLPALAVGQLRLLEDEEIVERVPVYVGSAITILLLGGVALLVGARAVGLEALGLAPYPLESFAAWTLGLTLAGLALILLFHLLGGWLGVDETAILEQLLPVTPAEKLLFSGLSLAAGLGEELAYRGFAITAITLALSPMWIPGAAAAEAEATLHAAGSGGIGVWIAAVIASAAFGFLHAYQGAIGIIRTALLGFVLAVSFLMSTSLWPAIAAHALIDLVAGLVLGRHLLRNGKADGN